MVLTIPLPASGKPLIKAGQRVDFDTPLYEQKVRKEIKVFISQKIDVSPKKIFQYIKKLVGESIEEGEILAEKKSFMGSRSYKSEFSGILKEINHTDGSVLVEVSLSESSVQKSFFKGEVTASGDGAVHLKVERAKEYEAKEGSAVFGGKAYFMKNEHDILSEEEVEGCIIVCEEITSYAQMKMEALGASGFLTLHHLSEKSDAPQALFKQIKDFEEASKHKLPYCFVNDKTGKITFYS